MTGMFETATYLFGHKKRSAVRTRKRHTVQYLLVEHSTGSQNTLSVTRAQHPSFEHSSSH